MPENNNRLYILYLESLFDINFFDIKDIQLNINRQPISFAHKLIT